MTKEMFLMTNEIERLHERLAAVEKERDAFRENFKWWKSAAKNHRSELESERADHRLTKRILADMQEERDAWRKDADEYHRLWKIEVLASRERARNLEGQTK